MLGYFGVLASGPRVGAHIKHEGDNQKWVLRSDGDVDG